MNTLCLEKCLWFLKVTDSFQQTLLLISDLSLHMFVRLKKNKCICQKSQTRKVHVHVGFKNQTVLIICSFKGLLVLSSQLCNFQQKYFKPLICNCFHELRPTVHVIFLLPYMRTHYFLQLVLLPNIVYWQTVVSLNVKRLSWEVILILSIIIQMFTKEEKEET